MQIQFFCPHWGSEQLRFEDFARQVKAEGYDGVEMSLPLEQEAKSAILSILKDYGLALIAQHWETVDGDFALHKIEFDRRLRNLADARPIFINSQTGKDYFSFEENSKLIGLARDIENQTGVRVIHETHRGKFSFAAHVTKIYLEKIPDLRITLDASHWCTVAETLLEDQADTMELACRRTVHVHARVGYSEGPQVPDPRDKLWRYALGRHLGWWRRVMELRKADGVDHITITPEFGAPPYMILTPIDHRPICDQWQVNIHMMNILRDEFSSGSI